MLDNEKVLEEHKRRRGKLEIIGSVEASTREQLSIFYTPGVAHVS